MSQRAVLLWLAAAIVLASVTTWMLAPKAASFSASLIPAGEPIIEFSPASVRAITLSTPASARAVDQVMRRGIAGDERNGSGWRLMARSGSESLSPGTAASWPLNPMRVRALLELFLTTRAGEPPAPDARIPESALVLTLELDSGESIVLRFSSVPLAGTVLLEVDAPVAGAASPHVGRASVRRLTTVDARLLQMLTGPGPKGWRESGVLGDAALEASRIRLEGATGVLALARMHGQWALTEPVSSPAEAAAVERLVAVLKSLKVARFFDDDPPPEAETGLAAPEGTVTVEIDRRRVSSEGDPSRVRIETQQIKLVLGGPADASGRQLYARVNDDPVFAIDAEPLAEIRPQAERFVSLLALPEPAADVRAVRAFLPRERADDDAGPALTWARRMERWVESGASGVETQAGPADSDALDEVLALLSRVPATRATLAAPAGVASVLRIELLGAAGVRLRDFELGGDGVVVVRAGSVWRSYDRPAKGVAAAVARLRERVARAATEPGIGLESIGTPQPPGDK
ncbi:MAG: DUF4340 domain-containing protein [Phycisphaerae bacterium]|nr:DUF4340 domain-containing protein [Phycisphaerae bacterium]